MRVLLRSGPLGERPFRRYFVGRVFSNVGDLVVPIALAFAVLDDLHGSAGGLGVVLAAETVPLLMFVLLGGALADRLSPRRVMLVADLVRMVVEAVIAVLLLTGQARLWELVVAMAVYGTAQAVFSPAATGLVPTVVSAERLQSANALLGLARSTTLVGGPALSALLVAIAGAGSAFALDAATFAISAWSLAGLPRDIRPAGERESLAAELRAGWREFRRHRWVWVTVLYFGAYQATGFAPYLVLGPVIAKQHLGGASAWALIVAAGGVGSIVGGLVLVRLRPRHPLRVACLATFLEAPALVLLGIVAPLWVIVAAWLAAGVTNAAWGVLWDTALQEHVAPDALNRVAAYDYLGSVAASPLSFALVGLVAAAVGAGTTLVVGAVILVATTVLLLAVPEVRNLGRRDLLAAG